MKGIVDRFENDIVVIEIRGQTEDVSKDIVHDNVREGDVVLLVNGKWVRDEEETKKREREIQTLMDDVWED
ncbi:DUF3006 domain-containing protein [Priestia koreensis]|uniref:DUF3006 domain-containing protein n=1 Tax=Priestia koreensis TaxID=284581 RepID=UPI001F58A313|nr:DUF3006 domain-containing protein [Priestia koreensis]UNL83658.1 DUF3006 domain-containing protein [Priestia koreensis]